jgi:hypothetical protein
MLTGRLMAYVSTALEENEFFDLMTLMRRIFANKTLMDFNLIIEKSYIPVRDETLSQVAFERKIMRGNYRKVIMAFESLESEISLDEIRTSTYKLRDGLGYTFMEAFWILLAWDAFGEESTVPVRFFQEMVLGDALERERVEKKGEPSFAMVGLPPGTPREDINKEGVRKVDILQILLNRIEMRALSVKANHIYGKMSKAEAADAAVLN